MNIVSYCSLPPRWEMAERFRKSGKEKLVLLLLSDTDPDGNEISTSFARSMREDFHLDIHPVRVALTPEQVKRFRLPRGLPAKKKSTNYAKYAKSHGKYAHELEALSVAQLQILLTESIDAVLDREAFNEELEAEKQDAAYLEGVRRTVHDMLSELDLEGLEHGND